MSGLSLDGYRYISDVFLGADQSEDKAATSTTASARSGLQSSSETQEEKKSLYLHLSDEELILQVIILFVCKRISMR